MNTVQTKFQRSLNAPKNMTLTNRLKSGVHNILSNWYFIEESSKRRIPENSGKVDVF